MNEYRIPAGEGESELTEKRSRFLGHVRMVESEEQARDFIAEMKRKYHDYFGCSASSLSTAPVTGLSQRWVA